MMNKKAFTLIEIVIGMVLIGVGLTAIMGVLQYATKLNNNTKAQIVATNLAREGVETMFSIRDTNWRMYSSKKDQCWLALVPLDTTQCEAINWIPPGSFTLGENYVGNYSYYPAFVGDKILRLVQNPLDVQENNQETTESQPYRMCFKDQQRKLCSDLLDEVGNIDPSSLQTKYGRFRREITVKGIFLKDNNPGGTLLDCGKGEVVDGGTGIPCGGEQAKELRFCSRVDYIFDGVRKVELCTAMTNFLE